MRGVKRSPLVVTGLGAVSAWGWGVAPLWQGLLSGRTAIGSFDRFATAGHRTQVAAQAPEPPAAVRRALRGVARLSRADAYALAAAREAWSAAAGASWPYEPAAVGVFFGGSTAGMEETERYFASLLANATSGPRPGVGRLATQPINSPADTVARHLGCGGPVLTVSSACASGTQALGLAQDALEAGDIDVALVGGGDSLCQLTYAGFNALRVVDEVPCRPFRAERTGMSLGEGAGVVVIERAAAARARGVRPLAILAAAGNSCDAHHMTAPHPDGIGAALAVGRALAAAGVAPDEVDFINLHGTGTPLNDASEWQGFRTVFGDRAAAIPLTATKASVGHLLGSSGAIEAVATVLCLHHGQVHPTPPGGTPDAASPGRLVLGTPLPLPEARVALSTSFGFGGANAAAVFRRVEEAE
ncbi:MAG: beta-ketoacyl-[acyl-carrier-protein] synthase family protein [Thermoanaerobaculia bacterium]|nr:beta-ketoacyl-[acyl-carrier-protein] synthase family protein [Thermoanaerobaculia bacterium]